MMNYWKFVLIGIIAAGQLVYAIEKKEEEFHVGKTLGTLHISNLHEGRHYQFQHGHEIPRHAPHRGVACRLTFHHSGGARMAQFHSYEHVIRVDEVRMSKNHLELGFTSVPESGRASIFGQIECENHDVPRVSYEDLREAFGKILE